MRQVACHPGDCEEGSMAAAAAGYYDLGLFPLEKMMKEGNEEKTGRRARRRRRRRRRSSLVQCEEGSRLELVKKEDYVREKLAEKNEFEKTEEGIRYRDLKIGGGRECVPGCIVFVHYEGQYTNGRPYESTWKRSPKWITLQIGSCPFKALDRGLLGMREGGKRQLIIPPHLCHDEVDDVMVYEVELFCVEFEDQVEGGADAEEVNINETKWWEKLFKPRSEKS